MKTYAFLPGAFALTIILLNACASNNTAEPPAREPSKLNLSIQTDSDINLDEKGRAAPLKVRVYELKSDIAFQEADFFSLQSNEKTILGSDLLAKDEYILRPATTEAIHRKSLPNTTTIGILAAYRNLPQSTWRAVYKLPPAPEAPWYRITKPVNKIKLQIKLESTGIKLIEEKETK